MNFAIVTPSFNQARFIKQTIKSVLTQSVKFKYWVMDGGSTDQTVKILKSFGRQVNWVSHADRGQTDAINQGIARLKNNKKIISPQTIFAYLNSDDYYLPQALNQVAQVFTDHPEIQWLVGDALIVNEHNQLIQPGVRLYKQLWRRFYLNWWLKILNPFPQPATFVRWSAIQKTGLFNHRLHYVMDYEYWLKLQKKFGRPYFLHQPLAAFRIHHLSKSGSQYIYQFAEQYQIVRKFTRQPIVLWLHRIHSWLIVKIYQSIK
jgi:glycosyltransferase involved in cell wall biosynthesis